MMEKAPIQEGKIFLDLHSHLPTPKNKKQLTAILNKLTEDITGITAVSSNSKILTYEKLVNFKHDEFEIEEIKKGIIARIRREDKEGYIINTQEVGENISKPHILAVGCKKRIDDELNPEEIIEEIHKQGGLSIISHPYVTSSGDLFRYRLISPEESINIDNLCSLVDEIETDNGQCIDLAFGFNLGFLKRLNMKVANELAKGLTRFGKKGIAASDTHFELEQIRTSGIYLPAETDKYLLESLKHNIITGNFQKYVQEINRISFLRGMFLY